jgi:hypothetical protein
MIDDPVRTGHLFDRLKACLPFPATLSPPLAATIREQSGSLAVPSRCDVTQLHYAGDEGGIICGLDLAIDTGAKAFFVSITHLLFDRRLPLAREIAAYQKHRGKRMRRQGGRHE